MKNLNKFVIYSLVGVMALNLFIPTTSALTLKERDNNARAEYQAAKAQYLKEVNWYKTSRQQYLNAKAAYQNAKNSENLATYNEHARDYLETAINVLIGRLETIRTWISNRGSISETTRQEITTEINEDINWLQDKNSNVQTASLTQIKLKAKEVLNYWHSHKIFVKEIIGHVWEARLSWTIERYKEAAANAEAKIDELNGLGYDTTQLETWLNDFYEKVDIAEAKRDSAREKWQAISASSSLASADQLFRQAHQFMKDANSYLLEAHETLRNIVNEMKTLVSTETAE